MIKLRLLFLLVLISSTVFGQFRDNNQKNRWTKQQAFADTVLIDTAWLSPSTFTSGNLFLGIDTTGLASTGRVFIQATQTVGGEGGGTWGSITGTLSNQTDLQNALNAKANLSGATFTGNVIFNNSLGGYVNDTTGTPQIAFALNTSNQMLMGDADVATVIRGSGISFSSDVSLSNRDLTNVDQITQSHPASGTGVSLTHSGTGNALVINKTNSGDGIDVVSGSIRIQSLTADRYLYLDAGGRVVIKTTAEVLSEIGALPLSGGTMTGAITGDQRVDGYRGVGDAISSSTNLDALSANTFYEISSGATITITDDANTAFPIGTEFEFFNTDLDFPTFTTSGSQEIRSEAEAFVTQYGHVTLKKIANNTWALYGRF